MSSVPHPPVAGHLRRLTGQSVLYGLGSAATSVVGIVLLPMYGHFVTRSQFGAVELVTAAVTLVSGVSGLCLYIAMVRFYFDSEHTDSRRLVVHGTFVVVLAASTVGCIGLAALCGPLAGLLGINRELILIGAVGAWVTTNLNVMTSIYRVEQRATAYLGFVLANVAISTVATVILVAILHMDASGILLGNFGGSVVVYVVMLLLRRPSLSRRLDWGMVRRMLEFALPFVPATVALWALNLADRFQVAHLASYSALGSYSAASKLALGMMLVVTAFQTAWPAFANSIVDDHQARAVYRAVFKYWVIVMVWAFVALSVLAPIYIYASLPQAWSGAASVVPLLVSGTLFYGAFQVVTIANHRAKRTKAIPIITGFAAAVNITLNFLAIPRWGIIGAGATTTLGYALLFGLSAWYAGRVYTVRYDWMRAVRAALLGVVLTILAFRLPETSIAGVAGRIALVGAYPVLLLVVGGVSADERRRGLQILGALRHKSPGAEFL